MRKPTSMLVGGKRFDLLPPRSKKMPRARGGEAHLGPTAMRQLEALARLYGTTLNAALARCVTVCFDGARASALAALQSPYAADRTMAQENLDALKGATKNTARNLRDR